MKIESVRIQNFRAFKDEIINFNDYTCFVGANGSGKSTILTALNIFFRQHKDTATDLSKLSEQDFHLKNTDEPIKITVTFSELSDKAKEDLSDYARQDKLIVSSIAEYDKVSEKAEVKQYGSRLGFQEFTKYFEAEKSGALARDLKEIYKKFKSEYPDLASVTSKPDMANALREYEAQYPEKCIPLESEDQFYGATKGADKLGPHIQWVFVPASKNLTEESEESKNSVLGQLLERTIRSKINFSEKISALRSDLQKNYQKMLDEEQGILNDISQSLEDRLRSWSHPNTTAQVLWKSDPDKSVRVDEPWAFAKIGERGFEGDLARFGHGLQRSYMLALLQELSEQQGEDIPTLIMGIEEPEIYQHPPQARYLAEVLHSLSESGSQIITCSHNPLFIPGDNFEAVRVVREDEKTKSSTVSQLTYDELSKKLNEAGEPLYKEKGIVAKLYPSLNPVINEMFFCKNLILVEGLEDVAYIMTYLMLKDKFQIYRKNGCHIVPVGGKSEIIKPLCIAELLDIPVFVVCDADTNQTREDQLPKHKKNNASILSLLGYEKENEWPESIIWKNNLTMWQTNITDVIRTEIGESWTNYLNEAYTFYGQPGGLNKNPLAIARALKNAWESGDKSESLDKLVGQILSFVE
jgi:putative ATP-dependent endonuclease of the OLD family